VSRRTVATLAGLAVAAGACLPNPQSVRERRAEFDRSGLEGAYIVRELPPDIERVGAIFDDAFELVGYTLDPPRPKRGDTVRVVYYWTALSEQPRDFRVFIHGDAIEGSYRRLHGDHWPADGKYPTGVWRTGEYVRDPFTLAIPGSYGPPRLGLYSGLYRGDERLRVSSRGRKTATSDNRSLAVEITF
jgi:hypothetical protein